MKHIKIFTVILLLITACNLSGKRSCENSPTYFNTKNDLDEYNLFGSIRNIVDYIEDDGRKNIRSSHSFTKLGLLSHVINYGSDSTLSNDTYYKYDDKDRKIWSKENMRDENTYLVTKFKYDTLNYDQIEYTKGTIFTDTINYVSYNKLDDRGIVIRDSIVYEYFTSVNDYKYDYNNNGKINELLIIENDTIVSQEIKYFYNKSNKIQRVTTKTKNEFFVTDYSWNDEILISEKNYLVNKQKDTVPTESTSFDDNFNPIVKEFYNSNFKIESSQSYKYEFDQKCNWISQDVLNVTADKKEVKTKIVREIIYWK